MTDSVTPRQVGLIGFPLRHSISPVFQQAAFDALGIAARYHLWETPAEQLGAIVNRLRNEQYFGANVTIPYKQDILPFLDDVDPNASLVGAVNTIVRSSTDLRGYNTDIVGFSEALRVEAGFDARHCHAVVLGAGGAARGVVAALLLAGASSIVVASRRVEQAESLIRDLAVRADLPKTAATAVRGAGVTRTTDVAPLDVTHPGLRDALAHADLVVNATPVGTAHRDDPSTLPIDASSFGHTLLVFDLVYNPPETPLLRVARESGTGTLNGLPMLVYQGAAAFELWTGQPAPVALMRARAMEPLGV